MVLWKKTMALWTILCYYTKNYGTSIYEGKTWKITENYETLIYNGKIHGYISF